MSNELKNFDFDICIIGGSIAGNYLSFLLSNSSLRIAVIEEHEKIGKPLQCAGIISQKLADLIDIPENVILNRVKIAQLVFPSRNSIELSGIEKPYVIDRILLDRSFYKQIKDLPNIEYFLGEKLISFNYINKNSTNKQKFIEVHTSKRKIITKLLIGCDGPLSTVAEQLGIRNNLIYAGQIRINADFDENKAYLYFDEQWKDLFGWIVPEGNTINRIGLACSVKPMEKLRIFLKKIDINSKKKRDQQGGIIPIGTMNKMAFDNILLLGDAACMVKATTGGGIIMLLIAAKFAALTILKSVRHQNFSERFIEKHYEKPCKASIGRELKIHYIVHTIITHFSNKDFNHIYRILNQSDIKMLIKVYGDMDFPRTLAFKMITNIPFLIFLLKFLLKNPILIYKVIKMLLS
jgi:flavin-dependent dehydrogenase